MLEACVGFVDCDVSVVLGFDFSEVLASFLKFLSLKKR